MASSNSTTVTAVDGSTLQIVTHRDKHGCMFVVVSRTTSASDTPVVIGRMGCIAEPEAIEPAPAAELVAAQRCPAELRDVTPRTVADVNRAFKRAGIAERLVRGDGYYWFAEGDASSWYSSSVYVSHVTANTIGEWFAARAELLAENRAHRGE